MTSPSRSAHSVGDAQPAHAEQLPSLSAEELARYSRQLTLPSFGLDGQRRLKGARVLIVGTGGLGSPTALYLAGAGVGTLGLVDGDVVDVTNIHRQLLHGTADVGRLKLDSAFDRLHDVNPHVQIERHNSWLTSANALEVMRDYDVIVDGTDNFATRYLVNDACVLLGRPNVYGSIFRFEGQASVFSTADGPCYRCLYPEPPPAGTVPSCAEGGVLGVLPGLVGTIQATEAIKLIVGAEHTLAGRLLLIDAWSMQFRTITIERDPHCPACGTRSITELVDYDALCGTPPVGTVVEAAAVPELTPLEVHERQQRGDDFVLLDVREPHEWELAHVDGAQLIPLGTLAKAVPSLDPQRELVVMCQAGGRSLKACAQLREAGFQRVSNMSGGMSRWQRDVRKRTA